MIRRILLTVALLTVASSASAQIVPADSLYLNQGPCLISSADGTPDTIVFGCPTLTTDAATNLTIKPTGDLELDPTGNDVLPVLNYDINLGMLSKKYLTLHAAELWVETLVAQDTIATIGGRVLVAPTTTLTSDLGTGATSIEVKHNEMVSGDRVYMEADGKVEFMAITSGPSGAGPYTYSVTRNLDGSGANQWYAGDAMLNTGTTGDGFIDLYSLGGVLSSGVGPAIVGNVRTGTTYNAYGPRWAIGNLNGLYGYGATTYGAAFGDSSATNVTVDATNGFRIRSGSTNKLVADTAGNLSIVGDLTVGTAGTVHSAAASSLTTGTGFWIAGGTTPVFRFGDPAGEYISWNGSTLTVNGRISVGTGRNLITNSECRVGVEGWSAATASSVGTLGGPAVAFSGWILNEGNQSGTCYVNMSGTPNSITDVYYQVADPFAVQAGSTYEASVYVGNHRNNAIAIYLVWLDTAGAPISYSFGNSCGEAFAGGAYLVGYCRTGVVAVAPVGAVTVGYNIRTVHHGTSPAGDGPFTFFTRAYFGEATPGQSQLTPWGAAGATIITPGLIVADAITTDKILAGTIIASDIATGTITATQIAAGTITADRMNVTELSGIAADLGHITAGDMVIGGGYGGGGMDIDEDGFTRIATLHVGNIFAESSGTIGPILNTELVNMDDLDMSSGGSARLRFLGGGGTQHVCADNNGFLVIC